ncbi:MAG: CDP-alcohol phosphatidyltransferase family protein [Rhodopirellula sp.]|nr:CDP-alcohol phosphatidyltransferase family protein [Rhodopirellula sp.]
MTHFNYFAESEQAGQERFQRIRDGLFEPLVRLLIRCRVTADLISLLSLLQLVPFGYLLLAAESPQQVGIASIFVWLHVVLDALDGPIARATGTAGPAGAFTDMCVDHSGMLITTCILTAAGLIEPAIAVAYASSYTVAIAFTIWLNRIGQPFKLVVRTKYLLYALVTGYGLFDVNLIARSVVVFCVIHVCYVIAGFCKLRRILRDSATK